MPHTKKFSGEFDFPLGTPVIIHEMPDGKAGFELIDPLFEALFEALLEDTPECNDFRMLNDGSRTWFAYSTRLDKEGQAIRASGKSIHEALRNLRENLHRA